MDNYDREEIQERHDALLEEYQAITEDTPEAREIWNELQRLQRWMMLNEE